MSGIGHDGLIPLKTNEGDPKVKDRLKGYLSFFITTGKSGESG